MNAKLESAALVALGLVVVSCGPVDVSSESSTRGSLAASIDDGVARLDPELERLGYAARAPIALASAGGAAARLGSGAPGRLEDDGRELGLVREVREPIAGRYNVVFRDDRVRAVDLRVDALARRFGLDVHAVWRTALRGFSASMSRETAEAIARDPDVRFVEEDGLVHAIAVQSGATWGLDRVDSRTGTDGDYEYTADGTGVHAYVVDTGIRASHSEFTGRMGNGIDYVSNDTTPNDCNGHGTHVAGTLGGTEYGVAKNVTLHGVRVLSCSGSGSISGVANGVDWVAANAISPAVANMSLGGGASSTIDSAVNGAISAGVAMVVAAGNSNTDACGASPARVADAITVGSTTNSDTRSSFSNYGSCLDLFAPGSSITSAWYTSDTSVNTISGTSMAAPHVAGVVALYRGDNPGASVASVTSAVLGNATSGVVSSAGPGSPNLLAYSLFGGSPPPPPPPSSPCSGPSCEAYSGSLSGSGDWDAQPSGTYFYSGSGTHQGWLEGPSSADFDLELRRWNGYGWSTVASSLSPSSSESITYSGGSGYYYWRIESYSGSGSYDFWMIRP